MSTTLAGWYLDSPYSSHSDMAGAGGITDADVKQEYRMINKSSIFIRSRPCTAPLASGRIRSLTIAPMSRSLIVAFMSSFEEKVLEKVRSVIRRSEIACAHIYCLLSSPTWTSRSRSGWVVSRPGWVVSRRRWMIWRRRWMI